MLLVGSFCGKYISEWRLVVLHNVVVVVARCAVVAVHIIYTDLDAVLLLK
jgi:hypothetical protein